MASETTTPVETPTEHLAWKGGALAGLVAGVVMGAMLTTQMTPVIEVAIPSMYGLEWMAAGWAAHLFHSAVLGIVFAAVANTTGYADSIRQTTILGLAYGVVLWVVLAALVMPIWLGAVGSPANPPFPNFDPMSLVGHLAYGLVLGVAFPSLRKL